MFTEADFEISLETQLKLRIIEDEIKHCDNVEELRKQLIAVTRLFTTYQQLLTNMATKVIQAELKEMGDDGKIEAMIMQLPNG